MEEVKRQLQHVLFQHRKLKAYIRLAGLLPGYERVAHAGFVITRPPRWAQPQPIAAACRKITEVQPSLAADLVVAHQAVRTPYFQEIQSWHLLQESLVTGYPSNGYRGEKTIAFTLRKVFGAIVRKVRFEEIFRIVTVCGTGTHSLVGIR